MIRIARKLTEEFLESGEGNSECLPRTSTCILRYPPHQFWVKINSYRFASSETSMSVVIMRQYPLKAERAVEWRSGVWVAQASEMQMG